MILLIILMLTVFETDAGQTSELARVNKCFKKAQRLNVKLNHLKRASSSGVRSYRRRNNHCIKLSNRYENRYEHLRILDEIEEEMNSVQ